MKTIDRLQTEKFETNSEVTDIKSTVRNQLKRDLMKDFTEFLAAKYADNENIDVALTSDGTALGIYNAEMDQTIAVVFDATFKKFDYDVNAEAEDYQLELEAKAEKKADREKAKQAKIKADTLKREQKALERQLREKVVKGEISAAQVEAITKN